MTSQTPRTPSALAAELYLLLLPSGHLLVLPVGGAMGTATDVALMLLLMAAASELALRPPLRGGAVRALRGESVEGLPDARFLQGVLVLVVLGLWMALSSVWGFHARYALTKGVGLVALAVGAGAIATSGIGRRRAIDAWLAGAALALVLTLIGAVLGGAAFRARVVYSTGDLLGLPMARISGPLLHPNMLGDYLLVSGILLWGRWPEWTPRFRAWGLALAAALGLALFLSVSTAWIAAGVALVALGRGVGRNGPRVFGSALAAVTLIAVLVPLDLTLAGIDVSTTGVRPSIWGASLYAFLASPVVGVGASPFLAEAVDPATGLVALWDAQNAYLSILGQTGLIGFGIACAGFWLLVRGGLFGGETGRSRAGGDGEPAEGVPVGRLDFALRLAVLAVAVHALFLASEDLRHVWALVGVAGAVRLPPATDRSS